MDTFSHFVFGSSFFWKFLSNNTVLYESIKFKNHNVMLTLDKSLKNEIERARHPFQRVIGLFQKFCPFLRSENFINHRSNLHIWDKTIHFFWLKINFKNTFWLLASHFVSYHFSICTTKVWIDCILFVLSHDTTRYFVVTTETRINYT